jgi:N-acetylmuramoyl-L-alanine amidase
LILAALAAPVSADGGRIGPSDRFDAVVIDPGHGGQDEGARSSGGLVEKEVVLDVSRRLARRLRQQGLQVVMTRGSDAFVPLETRTSAANDARADLFISVHANWSPDPDPRGIETYFASGRTSTDDSAMLLARRENEVFGPGSGSKVSTDPLRALFSDMIAAEDSEDSNAFARMAREELAAVAGVAPRDVKQAPFVVLLGAQMPGALIEIGFLSNSDDARALRSARHRESIAMALERAVLSFGKRYDARRGVGAGGAPQGPRQVDRPYSQADPETRRETPPRSR